VAYTPAPDEQALSHTNRHGVTWYLHEGRTKTGKPRYYVAKQVGEGARAGMPEGFEFTESINGVVSVRRIDPSRREAPPKHVEQVRREVARWPHLRHHEGESRDGTIVIHEPESGVPDGKMDRLAQMLGLTPETLQQRLDGAGPRVRYAPVMRFFPDDPRKADVYAVERMTYRGEGGWWSLSRGRLKKLVRRYVRHIGTEEFFDLL